MEAIKDVPVVEDGRVVPGKVMRMTLSVDHRVFYGATAAQFMGRGQALGRKPRHAGGSAGPIADA